MFLFLLAFLPWHEVIYSVDGPPHYNKKKRFELYLHGLTLEIVETRCNSNLCTPKLVSHDFMRHLENILVTEWKSATICPWASQSFKILGFYWSDFFFNCCAASEILPEKKESPLWEITWKRWFFLWFLVTTKEVCDLFQSLFGSPIAGNTQFPKSSQ